MENTITVDALDANRAQTILNDRPGIGWEFEKSCGLSTFSNSFTFKDEDSQLDAMEAFEACRIRITASTCW